eukprot:1810944-Pyramimonas_sp.AAC.1
MVERLHAIQNTLQHWAYPSIALCSNFDLHQNGFELPRIAAFPLSHRHPPLSYLALTCAFQLSLERFLLLPFPSPPTLPPPLSLPPHPPSLSSIRPSTHRPYEVTSESF